MSYITAAAIELSLLALLSGLAGILAVYRQRAFFTVALSHATFPGGVIAAILGANILLGQALAGAFFALLLALLSRIRQQGGGAATGIVLVFGFALGSLLTSAQRGFNVPVESLLVGSIFGVTPSDLVTTAIVTALVTLLFCLFRRELLFDTFDSASASAAGFHPLRAEIVTSLIVGSATVVALPAVGTILAVAMIITPAAIAKILVADLHLQPVVAVLAGLAGGSFGLWVSWHYGIAAGGAIGLSLAALFALALLWRRGITEIYKKRNHSR